MNYGNYFRLGALLLFLAIYTFSLLPIQAKEILRPTNPLRKLSYFIFAILLIGWVTLIPSIVYQWLRVRGVESNTLRAFVTYTATIGGIFNIILLWLIFHYKLKD